MLRFSFISLLSGAIEVKLISYQTRDVAGLKKFKVCQVLTWTSPMCPPGSKKTEEQNKKDQFGLHANLPPIKIEPNS